VKTAFRSVVVIATTVLGALFAIGFLISALFEAQGFGDRDSTPSGWRLVEYAVGFVACVVIPAVLWQTLGPARGRVWPNAFAVDTVGAVVILGLSLKA